MSVDNTNRPLRSFTAPKVRSRGTLRGSDDADAFKDLEAERYERQLKTERLRKLRMATGGTKA
ncbi:MAG: hypothetical protein AAGI89_15655 [Pseudomonadota bacterium]